MCINVDFKQQQRNLIPLETDFPQGNCHHVQSSKMATMIITNE